jgi:glycosyltransferase involved in cell wall biosynthesis
VHGRSDVVFFGTYDEAMHPRVRVLREGLAAHGATITVCNRPLGVDTAARVRLASRPWLLPGFVLRVLRSWRGLWRDGAGLHPEVVVVGYLGHLDVHLARRRFPAATLVLDHMVSISGTLADRGLGGGVLRRAAAAVDRAALRAADVVVVDTEAHAEQVAGVARHQPVVVPVGAPSAWFDDGPAGTAEGVPSAVFFGLYTPLQGTQTLAAALARLAPGTLRVTMVGDGQDRPAARDALSGSGLEVEWVDWCAADELPKVVAAHDICLGIFGDTPKAMRVVPNKVFQGAAAGCAIVTSDTPPQRAALGDAAVYVPPSDDEALAGALTALATDSRALADARARAAHRAADFRPEAVVAGLVAALAPASGAHPASPARPAPLALNAQLRWSEVSRLLERDRPARILELGCGRGGFGSRFARLARYDGVEPDGESRHEAASAIGADQVHESLDSVEGGDVDWLCSFEVLEHIEDDEGALGTWVERVRPGGRVVVSVPAHRRRYGAADAAVGHLRRYDPDDLRALLGSAGLDEVEVWAYGAGAGDVLEWGRNLLAGRATAADAEGAEGGEDDVAERTAGSGRWMVLPGWVARLGAVALFPFTLLQRPFGRRGIGPGLIGTGIRR